MNEDRKRIIVAFGDILGFGTWRRRAATQPEVSGPFLHRFYDEIQTFKERHPCVYLKYLGDGLMLIKELPETDHAKTHASRFIREIGFLNAKLLKIVLSCSFPAPEGFRTRVAAGHVDKLSVIDPCDFRKVNESQKRKIPEYVGYSVNLAQRLLEISPTTPLICHESVVKLIGKRRQIFRLRRLANPAERPRGVDQEDIDALWIVEF